MQWAIHLQVLDACLYSGELQVDEIEVLSLKAAPLSGGRGETFMSRRVRENALLVSESCMFSADI